MTEKGKNFEKQKREGNGQEGFNNTEPSKKGSRRTFIMRKASMIQKPTGIQIKKKKENREKLLYSFAHCTRGESQAKKYFGPVTSNKGLEQPPKLKPFKRTLLLSMGKNRFYYFSIM